MAKMIKFDLLIDGAKVKTFEELQDNLHADLLIYVKNGKLAKWFLSRDMADKAEATQGIDSNQTDLALMMAVCEVLELEADEAILTDILAMPVQSEAVELMSSESSFTPTPGLIPLSQVNNPTVETKVETKEPTVILGRPAPEAVEAKVETKEPTVWGCTVEQTREAIVFANQLIDMTGEVEIPVTMIGTVWAVLCCPSPFGINKDTANARDLLRPHL